MIRLLYRVLDASGRRELSRVLGAFAVVAIAQGIAFALLLPLLNALFLGQWSRAWTWTAVLAGVMVVHHVVLVLAARAGYELSSRLLDILLDRMGDHVAQLPMGWFGPDRTGSLGRMVGKGSIDISSTPAHVLRQLVAAVLTPLTLVVVITMQSPPLGVALVVGIVVTAAATKVLTAIIGRGESAYDASIADGSARVVEFALNQPALRVFGRTVHGNRLVGDALDDQERSQRKLTVSGFGGMGVVLLALQTVLTVVIALTTYLTLRGSLGAASMIALLILTVRFVEPLVGASELSGVLRFARGFLERILDLLDTPPLLEPETPAVSQDSGVEFRDVTFGYADDAPVLRGVSFRAPPRTLTAVVGPSGSGKTTLLRLIARFHDVPDSGGAVLIGGQDVRELGTTAVVSQIGMVFQDVYLFEGTLRENVLLPRPDATPDQLARAASLARVDEIVERLPLGWDTRVGEAGSTLSGGEKQRVSIARALLKDAPIVLLDEATAALDPQNEAAVQDALTALAADRTVIVIAHRLQTVTAADRILVLDEGRIVEQGSHDELLVHGGRYADFWRERSTAAGWRLASAR